jgi:hypothetical protein
MNPLLFANWRRISAGFTVLMWLVAVALVVVIIGYVTPRPAPTTHTHPIARSRGVPALHDRPSPRHTNRLRGSRLAPVPGLLPAPRNGLS